MPASRLKRLRYTAEWLLLSGLFAGLKCLPFTTASDAMGKLARALGRHIRTTRVAQRNLAMVYPEWSEEQRQQVIDAMWENLGRYGGELPHIAGFSREEFRAMAEILGEEHVHAAQASGKGVIYFSAHMGNWELGAKALWTVGSPVAIVYRPLNSPGVEKLSQDYRNHYQLCGLPKTTGNRQMLRMLKEGKPIAILIDQKMNNGTPIPFFGHDAMTSTAIADMAVRYGYPLIPTRVERLDNTTRYRITFEPPVEWERTGDNQADAASLMRTLHGILERWIGERPEQWFWLHKRWG